MTTINDIAKVAGVSISTVSRILNNKEDVAASTRQRVLDVIDDLGYQPHFQARRLRTNAHKSNTISLLYPLENTPFDSVVNSSVLVDYIQGISRGVEQSDFQLNLVTSNTSPEKLLNSYRSSQIDGAIIMQVTVNDPRIQSLRETNYPFIMIGRTSNDSDINYIDFDYEQAVIKAFTHLQSAGHSRIGFLTYPKVLIDQQYGPAYYAMRGYNKIRQQQNTPYMMSEINMQSTIDATQALLAQYPAITALVVVHGEYLNGVVAGIHNMNRRIPDDISIVVISNNGQSEIVSPSITRVDLPALDMGYRAARTLIRQIEGDSTTIDQHLCDTQIYEGNSIRAYNSHNSYQ